MATLIQNTSWAAYDERKVRSGQDPKCFSPEELWEFNYLVELIHAAKPHLDQITVILAVRDGMRRTMAPRLREHFVGMVLDTLTEREQQWTMLMERMGQPATTPNARYPYIPN